MANELLSIAYEPVKPEKAKRLKACATQLTFAQTEEGLRLRGAFFCRVRLCPMCSWRRSLKVAAQMHRIMGAMKKEDKPKAYILATFTVRNCGPEELDETISTVLTGFHNLTKYKQIQESTYGFYRSLEITHNVEENTFHPHIHAIFAVDRYYFMGDKYIKQEQWAELWKKALKINYTPVVDVRRVKGNTTRAVAEVAKYAVKDADFLIPDDWDLTVDTVRLLDAVLHNRRFVAFGGIFKQYHKLLNLDDAETGDLVHTDPEETVDLNEKMVSFIWYSGYRQYILEK